MMNSDSQDRYEAPFDVPASEVGLPTTNQEQNTGQCANISQDNECERWKYLFEMQQQNMLELIRAIREPNVSNIKITLPEFNPDAPEHDARAWCETVDICLQERPISGSDLIITMSKALKGSASSWLAQSSFSGITWPQLKDLFLARYDAVETPAANLWRLLNSTPREGECLSAYAGRFMSTLLARWKSLSKEQIAIALTLAHASKIEPRLQRITFTTEIDNRNKLQQELMAFSFRKRGPPISEKTTPTVEVKKSRMENMRRCYSCGKPGHVSSECKGNGSRDRKPNTRSEISGTAVSQLTKEGGTQQKTITPTCFKCGERGHIAPRCPSVDANASDARTERRVNVCSIQPAKDQLINEIVMSGAGAELVVLGYEVAPALLVAATLVLLLETMWAVALFVDLLGRRGEYTLTLRCWDFMRWTCARARAPLYACIATALLFSHLTLLATVSGGMLLIQAALRAMVPFSPYINHGRHSPRAGSSLLSQHDSPLPSVFYNAAHSGEDVRSEEMTVIDVKTSIPMEEGDRSRPMTPKQPLLEL